MVKNMVFPLYFRKKNVNIKSKKFSRQTKKILIFFIGKVKYIFYLAFQVSHERWRSISMAFCIDPVSTTFQAFTKNIASAFLIVLSRCAMITLVVVFGSFERMVSRSSSVTVSMLAVASSRMRSSGFRSTARMKAMICFCPRLIDSVLVMILVSSHSLKFLRRVESPYFSS